MTKETNLRIEEVGTNGHIHWVIVNGKKIYIDRKVYFHLMLLTEDGDTTLEDAADFQNQLVTGIPAF